MKKDRKPVDTRGGLFSKPSFWLPPMEYRKIVSEINQIYYAQYSGESICVHPSFGIDGNVYLYWFENHGFNDYNIYLRVLDEH